MIFLVGFMGSGKSTVGPALARRLNCPFLDLDTRIEAGAGSSISELFDRRGELAFREMEHQELRAVLRECSAAVENPAAQKPVAQEKDTAAAEGKYTDAAEGKYTDAVVALGGGAFAQARNTELIEQSRGFTVWLDAPVEVLLERCRLAAGTRPLAREPDRFHTLYRERLPFYARALLRVDATAPPESVVEQILAVLAVSPGRGKA